MKDQIELFIETRDTLTTSKWLKLLKDNLQQKLPIKKHVGFHGWIMDTTRALKHILKEVEDTISQVNNFNFAKHAFETKQGKIKKDFNIDLNLSIDNLIQNKDFNLDIVNQLHDKFVQLEGAKTLDNLTSVSPYFEIAPAKIRWQISKLNNLAHELFHWGVEYKRWYSHGWYCPEVHVHYYGNKDDVYFIDEDDDSFGIGYEFGRVYLGDVTVGKTYWDAFNDNDNHIKNNELEPPTNITADFHMYFGSTTSVEENKMAQTRYWKWLYDRGLRNHEPANTRVGQSMLGEINFLKTFSNRNPEHVLQNLNGYNNVYAIIVDNQKTTYEWIMSNEEIDIQYHA